MSEYSRLETHLSSSSKRLFLFLIISVCSLCAFAGKNILLQKNGMSVLLSKEKMLLPRRIAIPGNINILSENDTFRTALPLIGKNNHRLWMDGDNRGDIKYTFLSASENNSSTKCTERLENEYFSLTRTFVLQGNPICFKAEYTFECKKDLTLGSADRIYLPYIPLSPAFDRLIIPMPDGSIESVEAKDIVFVSNYPFSIPLAAISEDKNTALAFLPGDDQRLSAILKEKQNSRLKKGQSFGFSFILKPVPAKNEIIAELFEKYRNSFSLKDIVNLMIKSSLQIRRTKPDGALKLALKAIKLAPENAEGYNCAAYACMHLKDYKNQALYWIRASELAPENSGFAEWAANSIRTCVIRKIMNADEMKKAFELHNRSIRTGPDNPFAYSSAADTYKYTKEYEKAVPLYEKAISILKNSHNENLKKKFIPRFEKKLEGLKRNKQKNS